MAANQNNKRYTTQEFFEKLLEQEEKASKRDRRLMGEVKSLTIAVTNIAKQPQICQAYFVNINKRIDENKDDIKANSDGIRSVKMMEGVVAAVGTGWATFLTWLVSTRQ